MTAQELKEWFDGRELPAETVWIHKSMKVDDPKRFVELHFNSMDADGNERANEPLILRLLLMKKWLEENGHA
ncbi:DUF6965 family protein [Dyadobacter endophyticus]|uniref:DUF6965 domain-containing protein n=1 Tax=Dyadobacter endophyticus TaxID=1749036 RepID=A0ABQ1YZN5_9BACT|nr:hypothetical protein [Dyadobacter endophyticus]GGH42827.1 hypothetical protein GCM10007423_39750 [Dyadobacter endophyticus]